MRTLKNASTGYSPAELLYGYKLITPGVWSAPIDDFVEGEYEEDVAKRVEYIQNELVNIRKNARIASDEAKKKYATRYNETVHEKKVYSLGEQVLLREDVPYKTSWP